MTKTTRKLDELNNELETQLMFLVKSCFAFDHGDLLEAKRISSTLRTLLKDKGTSISLLGQLNRKNEFYSYHYRVRGKIPVQQNYLVCSLQNSVHPYLPNFLSEIIIEKQKPFQEWWDEIVITDIFGTEFSRGKIILTVAEQDGGSHVDPSISDDYFKLTRENSQKVFIVSGDFSQGLPEKIPIEELKPIMPPVWHTIRQIAHEILFTLGKNYLYDPRPFYQGVSIAGFALE